MSDQSQRIGRRDGRLAGLYRDHGGWLTRSLRRRFGEESDDIAHETWKRMVAFYGDAVEVRSPRALLLTIARRCAADLGRRRARGDETRSGLDWGNQGAAAAQDEALLLQQIILGLPEPLRDVFVMSRFVGLSNAEIAERLGIAQKTVEWRMTKALAHCAAQLR
ncbi:RNA polymerase sigma factor [Brevundimonas sp. SL130]|uniref:RNA polymerase sigma factor n=1 Tax=Brevundimonas sp. SL130 TaxID=2995143 RepID=UPI003B633B2E